MLLSVIFRILVVGGGGFSSSAAIQLAYSTALADCDALDISFCWCYGQREVEMIIQLGNVIKNILKENSTYIKDSWEKPLLSLTQSWTLHLFLVTAHRVCVEESLACMCHMRVSPSVGETLQQLVMKERLCGANKNLHQQKCYG